jgi:hypothetical protein
MRPYAISRLYQSDIKAESKDVLGVAHLRAPRLRREVAEGRKNQIPEEAT